MARIKDNLQKEILREVMCNDFRNNDIEIGITNYLDYGYKVQGPTIHKKLDRELKIKLKEVISKLK